MISFKSSPIQIKSMDEVTGIIEGYASVYGTVDSYGHMVVKGAFDESIKEWKASGLMPPMLWQHDPAVPIGPWLEMTSDDHGLLVRGQLLTKDIAKAAEAYALVKAKAVTGFSIGWSPVADEVVNGITLLKQIKLWEVSIVTFPANDEARATGIKAACKTKREFEARLRDELGFSWAEAKRISDVGFGKGAGDGLRDEVIATLNQIGSGVAAITSTITKEFKNE